MKKFMMVVLMALPMMGMAQDNTWEMPQNNANPDEKYLAGAVPEVDGKVMFTKTIEAPGKSKEQLFDLLLDYMTKMTKEANQFEQSRIVLEDKEKGQVVGSYQEWLVFKNKPLSLDRTRFFYHLIADVKAGSATLKLTRIHYLYEEERDPFTYKAEEWITDRYGLNKKQTKLARVSGKFRRKTIDRKDYIFNQINKLLTK